MKRIYCFIWSITLFLGGCRESPPRIVVLQPGQISASSSDTIYSIAKAHDISVRDLIETNHLKAPYILEEGKILTIPSKEVSSHGTAPEDDLDIMASGPIDLAQETWKDVPLEENFSPENPSAELESAQEKELLLTPTLPLPPAQDTKSHPVEKGLPEQSGSLSQSYTSSDRGSLSSSEKKKDSGISSDSRKKSLHRSHKGLGLQTPVSGGMECSVDKQTAIFQTEPKEKVLACEEGTVVYAGKCGQFHKDPALANRSFVFVSHDSIKGGKWTSVYLGILPSVKKD